MADEMKLYSLEQVSEILGVSKRTAWNYAKEGKIKGRKIGGIWKITDENLRRFINGDD